MRPTYSPVTGASTDRLLAPILKSNQPSPSEIQDSIAGYDLTAEVYDEWHWQRFWSANETPEILKLASGIQPGRLLDVGCGTGRYVDAFRSMGFNVDGVDVSAAMLRRAAENLHNSIGLHQGDARALPFPSNLFDCVLCCRVLSHIEQLPIAFSELSRVLRRGGRILVTDVDDRHDYQATRIPVDKKNVFIRVFKHSASTITAAAEACGLRPLERRTFFAKDLKEPPRAEEFPTIDWTNQRPIFFVAAFEKLDP